MKFINAVRLRWLALLGMYASVGIWVYVQLSRWHASQAGNMPLYQPGENCDMETPAGCVRHDYRLSWVFLWLLVGAAVAFFTWWHRRHPTEDSW